MSDYKETLTPPALRRISADPTGQRLAAKIARCKPDHEPGELVARFRTTVIKVEELVRNDWYIHLAGSHESLFVGHDKPELEAGDKIEVTLRRLPAA